jgi:predicted site-specific integrase-resolvase
VPSDHQKEDFERQVEILDRLYPVTVIIKDIESGLDFKRKSLPLLDHVYSREIEEIIVLYNDRLCRFDFELLEFICKKTACRIVVHSKANPNKQDVTQKLSEYLLSIVTVSVAKNNGLRAGLKRKKRRESEESQENQGTIKEMQENKEPAGRCKKIRLYPQ